MGFDDERFGKWEDDTHIPEDVMGMVQFIAEKVGCGPIEEKTITLYSRGGWTYAYAKGFTLTHCTSSMEDGPGVDYSGAMDKWLKGLGFRIENSYGDNGMDSATNWHDTYWTHEFVYSPSVTSDEMFTIWESSDYNE